ncbi:MAG: M28 family peptidase [Phycisphaerae bacterium]
MKAIRPARLGFLLACWGLSLAAVQAAVASDRGRVAAALVRQAAYRHVLDDLLYTRAGDNRGFGPEHDLAQANIVAAMSGYGLTVTLEPVAFGSDTYFNVVGTKWGSTDPSVEYIVGAHYDSVGNPGADDNASGVALVLEAARVLSAYDSAYTIRFIAFDREEQGLVGSQAYVNAHWNDDIRGMISTDMVAYNTGGKNEVDIFGQSSSSAHSFAVGQAVTEYGDGLTPITRGPSNASDHAPFEWAGIPACLLIESWGNPNYHTPADSVDTPDYIDYAFATRVARSTVGFLVDHAGVAVILPDADFNGDGNVDRSDFDQFALCFSGDGVAPTDPVCDFFDLDADGDVDCLDGELLAAVWTAPGDPPLFWRCNLLPPAASSESARCLTVTPPVSERPMALQVTGDPDDPAVACLVEYLQPDGRLDAIPVFLRWDQWGTIRVCDRSIIPGAAYRVACDFGDAQEEVLSTAVVAATQPWGDTVGPFSNGQWSPPDGRVDFIDILGVLDGFRGMGFAPPAHRVDLIGFGAGGMTCDPDGIVDMADVLGALDAFRGRSYEVTTGCLSPCGP